MTPDELEFALDDALAQMSKQSKDIIEHASEGEPLPQIINSTFDAIFDCLNSFKEKIVDYEKQKD